MIGRVIAGRYRLDELLGEGGMALVWKAFDLRLTRTVAIKLLRPELTYERAIVERFQAEAQLAARLSHPNIVRIFDVGQEEAQPFIVMELVDGRPLKGYIDDLAPFELGDVLIVVQQIAEALDQAHSQGVVHLDVKPENVLITEDGQIKVMDFGLARGSGSGTLAAHNLVMGTAHYLAPEQAQGGRVDARADVYALGVMVFEMLTGRLPFLGDSPLEVAAKHLDAAPQAPSRYNPSLSRELDRIVLKALAKEPSLRHASATAFADALALTQRQQPALVPRPDQPTVAVPPVRPPLVSSYRGYSGEPTVMMPVVEARDRAPKYWTGLLVGVLGLAFVLTAFIAGMQVLKVTPLAAAPDLGAFPAGPSLRPVPPQVVAAGPTGTPVPLLVPSATATASGSPTPTETETPTDTPIPEPTAAPTKERAAATVVPAATAAIVQVPDVVGMTEAQAQAAIKAAGLSTSNPNYQSYTSQAPGHVLSQQPSAGTPAARGSIVYIAVRR